MWEELQNISSLIYVASPILKIVPQKNYAISEQWAIGSKFKFNLYFFGFIPFGDHYIKLVELNEVERRIVSNEHGKLTKEWNHTIKFHAIDDETIEYTDEIKIDAGILTVVIWLIALVFYRHRQNKWKKLLLKDVI